MQEVINRNNMTRNARFWIYWNEPTKITLKPGQTIDLQRGGSTEEGFHYEFLKYSHEQTHIIEEWCRRARDCDGPLDRFRISQCSINDLKSVWNECAQVFYPKWETISESQRDYYAERMGY